MSSFCLAYRPERGECLDCRTEAAETLRRLTGCQAFFTWQNASGEWIVSYRYSNGYVVDAAFLNKGRAPILSRSSLFSLQSFARAEKMDKGPVKQAWKRHRGKQMSESAARQAVADEDVDMRRSLRRNMDSQVLKDLPWLKV